MGRPNLVKLRLLLLLELELFLIVSLLDQAESFLSLLDVLLDLSHLILKGLHSLLLVALGSSINAAALRASFLDLLCVGLQVQLFGQLGCTDSMVVSIMIV